MNLDRHARILRIMEKQNTISIKELALALNCTEMTVRRNLDQLQEQGLIQRAHGYATLLSQAKSSEYDVEIHEHAAEKKAIAAAALSFLQPGQSVCLDSGTTVQELAVQIPDHLPLSIITPSLAAALALAPRQDIQVMMPGGFLDHTTRSLMINDPHEMDKYHVDLAFLSCRSFQLPGGTFEHSQTMMSTKRSLADAADKKILLLDYSKWNVSSIFSCIPLRSLDLIITDNKAPLESVKATADAGVEVLLVNPETGKSTRIAAN